MIVESVSRKANPIVKPAKPREPNKAVMGIPVTLSAVTRLNVKILYIIIVLVNAALVLSRRLFRRDAIIRLNKPKQIKGRQNDIGNDDIE